MMCMKDSEHIVIHLFLKFDFGFDTTMHDSAFDSSGYVLCLGILVNIARSLLIGRDIKLNHINYIAL
jgi:hypothetical protein